MDKGRSSPLSSIIVIELSPLLPGPFCGLLLAQLGARVIKVEPPRSGDRARSNPGRIFDLVNRNKESLSLNLKVPKAREVLLRLAGSADVVIEGFRPGVADRLGVGYRQLSRANRAIVYCSISGFGQTGPHRDYSGHDATYLAWAGYLGIPGEADVTPSRPGVPIADLSAGMYAGLSVVAALYQRCATHEGAYLDVPITGAAFSWTALRLGEMLVQPRTSQPIWDHFWGGERMRCKDDLELIIAVPENESWRRLCRAIGREDLSGADRFSSPQLRNQRHRSLKRQLRQVFRERLRSEWLVVLREHDVPHAPVYTAAEALRDPHLRASGLVSGSHDPSGFHPAVLNPVHSTSWDRLTALPPPSVGEQNAALLEELGYTAEETAEVIGSGALDRPLYEEDGG